MADAYSQEFKTKFGKALDRKDAAAAQALFDKAQKDGRSDVTSAALGALRKLVK